MLDESSIRDLLDRVAGGRCSIENAIKSLRSLPFENAQFVRIDHHRALRTGLAEVVYCPGKTSAQVAEIIERLSQQHGRVLATRATAEQFDAARLRVRDLEFDPTARAIWLDREPDAPRQAGVIVAAAGTSDLPVAEEAALTATLMGQQVERLFDVGVAGLHRLLPHAAGLQSAGVIVAVAGMEGALPSVISGVAGVPVIGVPTSAGYGTSFGGVAALLAMLNSCAAGISVVNIDNGFGAGYLAALINSRRESIT